VDRAAGVLVIAHTGGDPLKAAYIDHCGGPEVLRYGELPDPVPGADEVLVDIHAASINAADWQVRAGRYGNLTRFPHILGRDFSGVVSACGTGVDAFRPGDAVFGVCDVGQEGAYADKIAIRAAILARKPDSLAHLHAAAVGLTGLTAAVSIEDTLRLKAGETILIHGGAGGVAGFAIQLARHIGARVITTTSAANADYVRSLGAHEVIDYHATDFTHAVRDCDAVFDTVGGDVALRSFDVLRPGGRAAFIASGMTAPPAPRRDLIALRPQVGRDRAHLERILVLLAAGAVRVPDITRFTLDQAAEAHRLSESRHLRGKLVFAVR
jgi:NADPH:quinone reductase-like Zn-dependent oxidoreductase